MYLLNSKVQEAFYTIKDEIKKMENKHISEIKELKETPETNRLNKEIKALKNEIEDLKNEMKNMKKMSEIEITKNKIKELAEIQKLEKNLLRTPHDKLPEKELQCWSWASNEFKPFKYSGILLARRLADRTEHRAETIRNLHIEYNKLRGKSSDMHQYK